MESAYPVVWREAFVTLASSSAALVGLLFIATSLHIKEISDNPILRRRTFNNTCYLLAVFVQSILFLFPQPIDVLGFEIIIVNAVGLWLPLRLAHSFVWNKSAFERGGGSIYRTSTFGSSFLIGIAGGLALLAQKLWGVYLISAALLVLTVTAVLNGWLMVVSAGALRKAKEEAGG